MPSAEDLGNGGQTYHRRLKLSQTNGSAVFGPATRLLTQANGEEVQVSETRADPRAGVPSSVRDKLVLTYDNGVMTDGVGAQLHRIYGIYALSRLLGVRYLHSPIARVDYQGLAALEANSSDPTFHNAFNDLFHIASDVKPTDEFHSIDLPRIYPTLLQLLVTLVKGDLMGGRAALLRVVQPHRFTDLVPDCYEACKEISPFGSLPREGKPLRVALHVRRGEQLVVFSERLLPNAYYIAVAQGVARILDALALPFTIELWTEVPAGEFTVYPNHHGISNRIERPVVFPSELCRLDDFDVLPNLVHCINGSAIDCVQSLATADILVMSRSSFSYVAAILNRDGVVMYHPFWHQAPSAWIRVAPDGRFEEGDLRHALSTLSP